MTSADIRRLFDYNAWANARFFAAMEALPAGVVRSDAGSSHGGIHGTMLHIVWAHHLWLLRWMGLPNDASVDRSGRVADLPGLRSYWTEVASETEAFLASRLTDAFLLGTFPMKTTKGESFTHSYGEAMLHLVNHSSYHRGQVASLIRQAGLVPPATDYIAFARERDAAGLKSTTTKE